MTKLILLALRALQSAADKSATKAARKQAEYRADQRSSASKKRKKAEALHKRAQALIAAADYAHWQAGNHDARAEVGNTKHLRHETGARSLARSIKNVTILEG